MTTQSSKKKQVLILGGGFGGVKAALELSDCTAYDVTLISDRSSFHYHPALYRAATGGSRELSSIELVELFEGKPITLVQDTAVSLDKEAKTITTKSKKTFHFDYLVVALGMVTNYFGIKGLKEFSYGIKSLEEARELRDHLHKQLTDQRRPDLNYVIVGGGPTGVELAGELPQYINHILKQHGIYDRKVRVSLVEGAPRLLPRSPKIVSKAVAHRLRRLGVSLHLNKPVQAETSDMLMVGGKPIKSQTVVWTAGVMQNPFVMNSGFNITPRGKVMVDWSLQAWPDIFVIGDNADTPYSGMAQTALRDAQFVVDYLERTAHGLPAKGYRPKAPVYVIPAGRNWAAVHWGKVSIFGYPGWVLRRAADLLAYHDMQPWWKASRRWLSYGEVDESCPECQMK